jgi:DNA-binding response OmpR family regulator
MLFGKRERRISAILVVEDEPLIAFDNEHFLVEAGYDVVATVDSHEEAHHFIETETIHLVLTDISLRGEGNGLDVARSAASKGVHVLFVSASCPVEARQFAAGCLSKPYSEKDLLAALEALDAKLSGRKVKRVPAGLEFYEKE